MFKCLKREIGETRERCGLCPWATGGFGQRAAMWVKAWGREQTEVHSRVRSRLCRSRPSTCCWVHRPCLDQLFSVAPVNGLCKWGHFKCAPGVRKGWKCALVWAAPVIGVRKVFGSNLQETVFPLCMGHAYTRKSFMVYRTFKLN